MIDPARLANTLGVPKFATALGLVGEVERGLPVRSVTHLFKTVSPGNPKLQYTVASRATLNRKGSAKARLSREQSDHLARIARVWLMALEVWKAEEAARAFLLRPHPMLDGRPPIDLTATTEGTRLVEGILGRLAYGSAA